jgi:hypothetical protein
MLDARVEFGTLVSGRKNLNTKDTKYTKGKKRLDFMCFFMTFAVSHRRAHGTNGVSFVLEKGYPEK